MLEREIGLANPISNNACPIPPTGITRIEHKSAINESDGYIDILIKISEHVRSVDENFWIVWGSSKGLPCKIDTLPAVLHAIVRPTVEVKLIVVVGGLCEGGAVIRITFYRLPEQVESVLKPFFFPSGDVWKSTQVQIVSCEITGWAFTGPANFSSL